MLCTTHNDSFKDYYFNDKGIFYKSFEININNQNFCYDIYWGDPNIVFGENILKKKYPLAVTIIPNRQNLNPRIFIHQKLKREDKNTFEIVIAHEIGHLWLHDIVGYNHPSTNYTMKDGDCERWADYFAYSYFKKHRDINNLDRFIRLYKNVSDIQMDIYSLNPETYLEFTFDKKKKDLLIIEGQIHTGIHEGNYIINQMVNAIEITLNALGDVFL